MSLVLVFIVILVLVRFVQKYFYLIRSGYSIPGPWFVPFIGNVQLMWSINPKALFSMTDGLRRTYQKTFRIFLGTNLWVFLHSSEETREALNEDSLVRADTFQRLDSLFGNGLLLSEGKIWHDHRRAFAPAFHPNVLASFTKKINYHSDVFVDRVLKHREVDIFDYILPCMMDTICDTSMGKNLRTQEDEFSEYIHAFHEASELLFQRMSNPLYFQDFIYNLTPSSKRLRNSINIIHSVTDEIIKEKAASLKDYGDQTSGKYNRNLLHILLTTEIDGKPLTFQNIKDEVNTFLFAGVDTTAAAMSFIFYCLAKYPECQEKLFNEISSFPEDSVSNVNEMKYLDSFIKECLRLYTIVPLTGRTVTKDIKIGSTNLVHGTTLWINMYGLAHDAKYFPEPYTFNPERFGSDGLAIPPYVFLPFSGGPHSCIGKRYAMVIIKLLTARAVERTKVQLKNPNEELVLMAEMVLKATDGIHLIFESR